MSKLFTTNLFKVLFSPFEALDGVLVNGSWLFEAGCLFVFALGIHHFIRRLHRRYKELHLLHEGDWRYYLDHALLGPFQMFIWILLGSFLVTSISTQMNFEWTVLNPSMIRKGALGIWTIWCLFRWKDLFEKRIKAKNQMEKIGIDLTSVELLSKLFTIVILVMSALVLLQMFGLNMAPFLAFGGIGAATLGFASKDMISNLYGGLTIHLARPFSVSEQIELPQKNLIGNVEKIGWYFTTLRDLSKRSFYVPNAVFTTEMIVNRSRITHQYINEKLSLCYADAAKAERIIQKIRELLSSHLEIDSSQPIYVFVHSFTPSSIDLEIRAYTLTTSYSSYMETKQKIMLQICEIAESEGATLDSLLALLQ